MFNTSSSQTNVEIYIGSLEKVSSFIRYRESKFENSNLNFSHIKWPYV